MKKLTEIILEREYQLPFEPSEKIERHSAPGHKWYMVHCIDWAMPIGTPILAAREGIVIETESRFNSQGGIEYIAKANYIVLSHDNEEYSVYAHLKWRGVKVKKRQKVRAGQIIGYSGQTGYAEYPHLHFGVYKKVNKTSVSSGVKSRIVNGELKNIKVNL